MSVAAGGVSHREEEGAAETACPAGAAARDAAAPLLLRLAVGVPELLSSLEKFQHLSTFLAVWHKVHLPAAALLAPAYAAAELVGALLLVVGWKTRAVALLFVAELVSEILITKRPLFRFTGWMSEWQSLCVVLVLASLGAGAWSLDRLTARPRRSNRPEREGGADGGPHAPDGRDERDTALTGTGGDR